jgi:hypothetical protein
MTISNSSRASKEEVYANSAHLCDLRRVQQYHRLSLHSRQYCPDRISEHSRNNCGPSNAREARAPLPQATQCPPTTSRHRNTSILIEHGPFPGPFLYPHKNLWIGQLTTSNTLRIHDRCFQIGRVISRERCISPIKCSFNSRTNGWFVLTRFAS